MPQAALKQASSRNQALVQALKQATRVQQQLAPRMKGLTDAAKRALQECDGWARSHVQTVDALRAGVPRELAWPLQLWMSAAAPVPIGLLQNFGPPHIPAVFTFVFQRSGLSAAALKDAEELLSASAAADQQGAALLASRDRAAQGAVAALQEFVAALTLLLPPDYAAQSQHAKCAAALRSLLRTPAAQVRTRWQTESSPQCGACSAAALSTAVGRCRRMLITVSSSGGGWGATPGLWLTACCLCLHLKLHITCMLSRAWKRQSGCFRVSPQRRTWRRRMPH